MAKPPMTRSAFASRAFAGDARGSTAVEFALIAPALFALIVGVLMLGLAYYEGATMQWSLERSMRAAMFDPDVSQADIEEMMAEDLERIGSPDIAFAYEIDESGSVPLGIATASFDVPLEIPFMPEVSLHFEAENVTPVPGAQ
jgi:Flp pilus assembly protein TadG